MNAAVMVSLLATLGAPLASLLAGYGSAMLGGILFIFIGGFLFGIIIAGAAPILLLVL